MILILVTIVPVFSQTVTADPFKRIVPPECNIVGPNPAMKQIRSSSEPTHPALPPSDIWSDVYVAEVVFVAGGR